MADKKQDESFIERHPIITGMAAYFAVMFLVGKAGEYIGEKIADKLEDED